MVGFFKVGIYTYLEEAKEKQKTRKTNTSKQAAVGQESIIDPLNRRHLFVESEICLDLEGSIGAGALTPHADEIRSEVIIQVLASLLRA